MLSIERHIAYLITRHDCVIVPGFGAFVSLYEPAYFDESRECFHAPRRHTVFNSDIAHNDAMIAASIARRESISYDRAAEFVGNQVDQWRRTLSSEGRLVFDGLGRFTTGDDGQLVFDPEQTGAFSNVFLTGLPALSFTPAVPAANISAAPPRRLRKFSKELLRAAASIAIIVSVLAAVFSSFISPQSPYYYASLLPAKASLEHEVLQDRPITQPYGAELRIAIRPAETPTPPLQVENPGAAVATIHDHTARYLLIVASLASSSETNRYLDSLEPAQRELMNVIRSDGRYRVYAAAGHSFHDADMIRKSGEFSSRYPDAWIYVRR